MILNKLKSYIDSKASGGDSNIVTEETTLAITSSNSSVTYTCDTDYDIYIVEYSASNAGGKITVPTTNDYYKVSGLSGTTSTSQGNQTLYQYGHTSDYTFTELTSGSGVSGGTPVYKVTVTAHTITFYSTSQITITLQVTKIKL